MFAFLFATHIPASARLFYVGVAGVTHTTMLVHFKLITSIAILSVQQKY